MSQLKTNATESDPIAQYATGMTLLGAQEPIKYIPAISIDMPMVSTGENPKTLGELISKLPPELQVQVLMAAYDKQLNEQNSPSSGLV